jgi:hypothetical protein
MELRCDGIVVDVTTSTPQERRVRHVGAVRAGANGAVEVLPELGIVLADPGYSLADRAGHTGSGTLGDGRGPPIATTQTDPARELSDQEVALGVGLRLAPVVPEGARLLDVGFDLGETAAVGGPGPFVEYPRRDLRRAVRPRPARELRLVTRPHRDVDRRHQQGAAASVAVTRPVRGHSAPRQNAGGYRRR